MKEAREHKTELIITRIFDAPREQVWKAWTEPERFKRWWGPKNFTSPVSKIDLRVDGKYLFCMRSPDGKDFWSTGVYREIIPMERLVLTDSFADESGNVIPASRYGVNGDWPQELLVTVTFEEDGGRTKMTLRHAGIPPGTMRELTEAGWNESFDKLAQTSMTKNNRTRVIAEPGKQEIAITRVFDAPRELVFRTYTDPNLIPQWWGPKYLNTTVEKMDARPGGAWRFVQRDRDGNEYAFHGVYHEIVPAERIVATFEFEGMAGHVLLETAVFEEHDGKTTLTIKSVFQTVEDRDGMLKAGMQEGAAETMDRFAELLSNIDIREKAA